MYQDMAQTGIHYEKKLVQIFSYGLKLHTTAFYVVLFKIKIRDLVVPTHKLMLLGYLSLLLIGLFSRKVN